MPEIRVSFSIDQPADRVWQFFQDLPAVAACMPGLTLDGASGPESLRGRLRVKLGPVVAAFEGEGRIVEADAAARRGKAVGKGVDRKGGSRAAAEVSYQLTETAPAETRVEITSSFNLTGALAQMGRTGIFQDVANELTAQFANALRAQLAHSGAAPAPGPTVGGGTPASAPPTADMSGGTLFLAALRGQLRRILAALGRLFGRPRDR